jgi:hypothetical protein
MPMRQVPPCAVEPANDALPVNAEAKLIGGEGKAERVRRSERHEGRLHHRELGQDRRLMVDELRDEGDEEGDTLGVERSHQEGVPENGGGSADGLGGPCDRRSPPQTNPEIDEICRTDPFQHRE